MLAKEWLLADDRADAAARGSGALRALGGLRGPAADRHHPRGAGRPRGRDRRRARARGAAARRGALEPPRRPACARRRSRATSPRCRGWWSRRCAARSPSASRATSRAPSSGSSTSSARSRARSPARWSRAAAAAPRPTRSPASPARSSWTSGSTSCSPSSAATATPSRSRSSTSTASRGSTRPTGARPATGCWPRSPAVLRRQLRDVDQAFRLEEDEFAILAPHTDAAGLVPMASRIAELVASSQSDDGPRIAIAAGVVSCPDRRRQRRAAARERRGGDLCRQGLGRGGRPQRAPAPRAACKTASANARKPCRTCENLLIPRARVP